MKLKRELPLILIVMLPFVYLVFIWNQLPDNVPVHWTMKGEIDRYGEKAELLLIPILLTLLVYFIFLIIPKIDPKNKLNKMGNKLQTLKFLMTALMSVLSLYILYSIKNQSSSNPNYIVLFIGVLYIIIGNYMKTTKANYFLGIRTPWTLENETVWKKTHLLGGKMFLFGGAIILLTSLVFDNPLNFVILGVITGIISILPIVYSFFIFKKENSMEHHRAV